jgi:hypothetical protein
VADQRIVEVDPPSGGIAPRRTEAGRCASPRWSAGRRVGADRSTVGQGVEAVHSSSIGREQPAVLASRPMAWLHHIDAVSPSDCCAGTAAR